MADHREVQRIETFLMEWLGKQGVRATREVGYQFVAVGEVEAKSDTPRRGDGVWRELDMLGCYPGTLQLVNITKLARDLVDEMVKA